MLTAWADLADECLDDVPGAANALGAKALRRAAQQFLARTLAWRAWTDPQITLAALTAYDLPIRRDQLLVKVLSATLDGRDLPLRTIDGYSTGVLVTSPTQFKLMQAPAAGQRVQFYAALMPSNAATGIEDWLANQYQQALVHGAKAELFGMKKQPFSDMTAAADERALFKDAIGKTIIAVGKAYSRAEPGVRPQFF